MKKVTIIIPNYNGLKFMEPCMAALDRQICRDFELLVVDNGSTDGSVEWLKEHGLPSIFLETNTGFSGAVNVGIRAAKTPYVILLNNDTEAEPEYVGELLKAIESSPRIFSVSPKMIQLYHKDLMDDGGDMYSIMGWAYQRRSTAGRCLKRSDISMRCILLIWKTSMWDTGQKLRDTITVTARLRRCFMWEAAPAAPSTIPLRSSLRPAITCI